MTEALFGEKPNPPGLNMNIPSTPACTIYTDGGCHPNGSPLAVAGWAFTILEDGIVEYGQGCYTQDNEKASNNKAEITAAIMALEKAAELGYNTVLLYSDSEYLIKSMMIWRFSRKKNKEIKNAKIFKYLEDLVDTKFHKVQFTWVKGHSTNEFNNLVDTYASHGMALEDKSGEFLFGEIKPMTAKYCGVLSIVL